MMRYFYISIVIPPLYIDEWTAHWKKAHFNRMKNYTTIIQETVLGKDITS